MKPIGTYFKFSIKTYENHMYRLAYVPMGRSQQISDFAPLGTKTVDHRPLASYFGPQIIFCKEARRAVHFGTTFGSISGIQAGAQLPDLAGFSFGRI